MYFPFQVYIARARPKHLEQSSVYQYKPLCERRIRGGPWHGYRVGDTGKTSLGPLVSDCIIIYISEDGVQSWGRPVGMQAASKSTGYWPRQHWYELSERPYSVSSIGEPSANFGQLWPRAGIWLYSRILLELQKGAIQSKIATWQAMSEFWKSHRLLWDFMVSIL
jgi:hypothetical protein